MACATRSAPSSSSASNRWRGCSRPRLTGLATRLAPTRLASRELLRLASRELVRLATRLELTRLAKVARFQLLKEQIERPLDHHGQVAARVGVTHQVASLFELGE